MGGMLGTSVDLMVLMSYNMKTSQRAINLTWKHIRGLNKIKKMENNH
jgi:hypothetical protein